MQKNVFAAFVLVFAFLLSCSNQPQKKQEEKDTVVVVAKPDSLQRKSFVYTKYELPLSVDIFKFLKSKGVEFNKNNLHSLAKKEKYFTEITRAQILGVYSSDLAYSTIFDKSQEAVDYFGVAIDLAYKLNIEEGYESELLDRAYDNIDNNDTLSKIASNAYHKTCTNLEKSNRENVLPFIVLGSWVESVYILTYACAGSEPEDGIYEELYAQKRHLEGLIAYFSDILNSENNTEKEEIKSKLLKLKELKSEYDKIELLENEKPNAEKLKEVIILIQELRAELV
jgi:hypothetical protein